MSSKLNTTASLLSLLLLTMPLTGCGTAWLREVFRGESKGTVVSCPPPLPLLPESALNALETAAAVHPEVGAWVVSLEKQYEFQDTCAARHG